MKMALKTSILASRSLRLDRRGLADPSGGEAGWVVDEAKTETKCIERVVSQTHQWRAGPASYRLAERTAPLATLRGRVGETVMC